MQRGLLASSPVRSDEPVPTQNKLIPSPPHPQSSITLRAYLSTIEPYVSNTASRSPSVLFLWYDSQMDILWMFQCTFVSNSTEPTSIRSFKGFYRTLLPL